AADACIDGAAVILRLIQIHRRASDAAVERAGGLEQVVAISLDVQTPRIHAPKQSVGRISLHSILARMAGLGVSGREHDLAVKPFERPSILHKPRRQVIEKFPMCRLLPLSAKITRRGGQWSAEVP